MSYHELWRMLTSVYEDDEAQAVARMVYEVRFRLSLSDICIGKDTQLSADSRWRLIRKKFSFSLLLIELVI